MTAEPPAPPAPRDASELGSEAVIARAKTQGRWMVMGDLVQRVVQFGMSIVLARLLLPEHYGLAATAIVLWETIQLLGNSGVCATLVQRRGAIEEHASAAFWLHLSFTGGAALLGIGLSFVAARVYGAPLLVPFMTLLASGALIRTLSIIQLSLLTRDVSFKRIAVVEGLAEVLRAAAHIAMAAQGFGAWSLIVPLPASEAIKALLFWRAHRWRPDWRPRRHLWRSLYAYGRYILGTELTSYLSLRIDALIVGKMLGEGALGIQQRAVRFAGLLVETAILLLARLALPTLAALRADAQRLREVLLRLLRTVGLLAAPAAAFMFVAAPELIAVLYGRERWGAAAPLVRIFCPLLIVRGLYVPASQALYATGEARRIFRAQLVALPILVPALVVGSRWGLAGVASASVLIVGATLSVLIAAALRVVGVGMAGGLSVLLPAAGLGGITLLAALLGRIAAGPILSAWPGGGMWPDLVRLALMSAACGLGGAVALRLLFAGDYRFLIDAAGLRRRGRGHGKGPTSAGRP